MDLVTLSFSNYNMSHCAINYEFFYHHTLVVDLSEPPRELAVLVAVDAVEAAELPLPTELPLPNDELTTELAVKLPELRRPHRRFTLIPTATPTAMRAIKPPIINAFLLLLNLPDTPAAGTGVPSWFSEELCVRTEK